MNKWDKIWKNRVVEMKDINDDVFDTFCRLKKADGFDTQDVEGYYEAFYKQWQEMADRIQKVCGNNIESVYEVGCGSGVNLYLFQKLRDIQKVGGWITQSL